LNRTDDDYLIKTKEDISTLRNTNKNAVFILGGDFNAPDINWQSNNITGAKYYSKKVNQTYLDLAAEHSLEQMVDFPTRGDNTLDLVFTSHSSYMLSVVNHYHLSLTKVTTTSSFLTHHTNL
jgi:hypothetical protein